MKTVSQELMDALLELESAANYWSGHDWPRQCYSLQGAIDALRAVRAEEDRKRLLYAPVFDGWFDMPLPKNVQALRQIWSRIHQAVGAPDGKLLELHVFDNGTFTGTALRGEKLKTFLETTDFVMEICEKQGCRSLDRHLSNERFWSA